MDSLGLDDGRWVVVACVGVGPLPGNLYCAKHRRHLLYVANELFSNGLNQFVGNMFRRIVVVDCPFEVVAWGRSPKNHRTRIFLVASLQSFNRFGRLAHTYQQQSRGQRVESSGMPDFDILDLVKPAYCGLYLVNRLKRSPLARLVYRDDQTGLQSF